MQTIAPPRDAVTAPIHRAATPIAELAATSHEQKPSEAGEPHDHDSGLGEDGAAGDGIAPAPGASAWSVAEDRATRLIERRTGRTLADHIQAAMRVRPGTQMLAIGAGAGIAAVEQLRYAPDAALVCVDSNDEWLQPGRLRTRELAVNARFAALDLDTLELERRAFDVIFCHATLYRVIELERMADQILRGLRPGGSFIIVDVVTCDGHAMREATREIAQAIWKTLPAKFRLNHTAHGVPLIDDVIWQPKPIPSGARVAHPLDILPAIERRFSTERFVPYFSLSRRFFDSMYGPNYDMAAPLDRAIFDWIWQLDLHYSATKRLDPETFFGIYRAL